MGLAGVPGPRAQSSSSEPHRTGAPWHHLRCISVTKSRTDCALTQQMVGGKIKAVSPWLKSASEKLLMGLPTVLAPSGEERTLGAAAQWHARVVWPCHCHGLGLIRISLTLRAARERLASGPRAPRLHFRTGTPRTAHDTRAQCAPRRTVDGTYPTALKCV